MKYVLITPAKNEEAYIEDTIKSVIQQTIHPQKWVVVSDASTDKTDEIVMKYATQYDFITLVRVQGSTKRGFASKVHAFLNGYKEVENLQYDFIGNLDADITFEPNYYESVLQKFQNDPTLGIAGGVVLDKTKNGYRISNSDIQHTAGAFQLFRRECYESIGGYKPLKTGGIDSYALIAARMKGWKTRMFRDLKVYHHKPEGTSLGGGLRLRFRQGKTDYNLGAPLLFAFAKSITRINEQPYFLSSITRFAGYFIGWLKREKRDVPSEVVHYYRKEQMQRLINSIPLLFKND